MHWPDATSARAGAPDYGALMTRVVAACLLIALLAGAGAIVAGGVTFSRDQQAEIDREAARPFEVPEDPDPLPPSPKLARIAASAPDVVGATISMDRLGFGETRTTIRAGQSVRWVNDDSVTHTLLADDAQGTGAEPAFSSGPIRPGGTFRATLDTPGTIRYVCTLHPTSMRALITVR